MRPDPAAIGGVAHHHIVDAPVRHEAEWFDQRGDIRRMMIDRLHQQRPWRDFRPGPKVREAALGQRAALHHQMVPLPPDEARFHAFLAGEARQFIGLQRVAPLDPGIADQQRALLPIAVQEQGGVEIG